MALDDSGTLVVNGAVQSGEILYPTYAKDALEYPYTVPEGCFFVLGDYRTQSEDSRDFGPVPLEDVQAKVITLLRRRSRSANCRIKGDFGRRKFLPQQQRICGGIYPFSYQQL